MKTPVRAGTLASTVLVLLAIFTVLHHSRYLEGRWAYVDGLKDGIAEELKGHLGTESIDEKYIGFGTPTPVSTPHPSPASITTPDTTPETPALSTTVTEATPETPISSTIPEPEIDGKEESESPAEPSLSQDENGGEDGFLQQLPDKIVVMGRLQQLPDKIVVMGRVGEEDATWVTEYLPDWQNAVYTVDDLNATFHTPMNKGKEAMVYLTYIIENYGNYPSTVAFIHSRKDRFWHSAGMPARSNMVALRALNVDYVQQTGFANLRCTLGPGCPAEVQPYRQDTPGNRLYEKNMTTVWELFFGTAAPEVIAAPCCAQFATSRSQIMARPLEDYVLYRQWLMETDLDDDNSGRVFEYLWHVVFGQEPVHCPDYGVCWANVYGGLSMANLHGLVYAKNNG